MTLAAAVLLPVNQNNKTVVAAEHGGVPESEAVVAWI